VPKGTLLNEMHRLAVLFQPAVDDLRVLLRTAAVKHADETPWRTDGDNGYAWVFVAGRITLFVCEQPRAMSLRTACAGDPAAYFVQAALIRRTIETIALAPARHPSVQGIQNIFRENGQRLWHWAEDPRAPAENNTAERAVRPLAIARKVSHGSQRRPAAVRADSVSSRG
jgi:hypothetical protein